MALACAFCTSVVSMPAAAEEEVHKDFAYYLSMSDYEVYAEYCEFYGYEVQEELPLGFAQPDWAIHMYHALYDEDGTGFYMECTDALEDLYDSLEASPELFGFPEEWETSAPLVSIEPTSEWVQYDHAQYELYDIKLNTEIFTLIDESYTKYYAQKDRFIFDMYRIRLTLEHSDFAKQYSHPDAVVRQYKIEGMPENPVFGDANSDGAVNAVDAASILTFAAQLGTFYTCPEIEGVDSRVSDVTRNGWINALDAAVILSYAADTGAGATKNQLRSYLYEQDKIVQRIAVHAPDDANWTGNKVFDSRLKLEEHLGQWDHYMGVNTYSGLGTGYDKEEFLSLICEPYTEEFFRDHNVVAIHLSERSSPTWHEVCGIDTNGDGSVSVSMIRHNQYADPLEEQWMILVQVDKTVTDAKMVNVEMTTANPDGDDTTAEEKITDIAQIRTMLTAYIEENGLDAKVVTNQEYPGYQPIVVEYNLDAEVNAFRIILEYINRQNMDRTNIGFVPIDDGMKMTTVLPNAYSTTTQTTTTTVSTPAAGDADANGNFNVLDACRNLIKAAGLAHVILLIPQNLH